MVQSNRFTGRTAHGGLPLGLWRALQHVAGRRPFPGVARRLRHLTRRGLVELTANGLVVTPAGQAALARRRA